MREAPSPIPREAECQGGSKKESAINKQTKTTTALKMERLRATLRSSKLLFFFFWKEKAAWKRIPVTWEWKEREGKEGIRPERKGKAHIKKGQRGRV